MDINPLAEANPQSLDELFSRDPLSYQQQDREAIILEMRRYRKLWAQDEAAGKTKASKAPREKKPNLSLDDLGL